MRGDLWPEVSADRRNGEPARPNGDGWIGTELRPVVAGARRRAHRDADRQIDTAHLLHSLLENDPRSREMLGRATLDATGDCRVARVLAYLAQRSIGYGMRWRGAVEDSSLRPAGGGLNVPGLSPAAVVALSEATVRATARGVAVTGTDLLSALVADPACRAAEVLRAVGADPRRLAVTSGSGPVARSYRGDGPVAS